MKKFAGFNAPPPQYDDYSDDDDDEEPGTTINLSNPLQPQMLPTLGTPAIKSKLLGADAEDSAPGVKSLTKSSSDISVGQKLRKSVSGKGKLVKFGSSEKLAPLDEKQPSFKKNGDSFEVDLPGELPKFSNRPPVPRHQNMSHSLVMCMDPTCTSCPPEFHAMRRRQRPDGPKVPSRSIEGSRTLKADLAAFSDDDDEDASALKILKKRFVKVFGPKQNIERLRDGWQTIQTLVLWTEKVNPNSVFVKSWNQFFVMAMFVAFAVDPLFFFVTAVDKVGYCVYTSWSYVYVLSALRTCTDFIYFLHMILQFRLPFIEAAAPVKRFYWFGSTRTSKKPGEMVWDRREIRNHYLKGWFALDVFGLLPIPQIMALAVIPQLHGAATTGANMLRGCVLLQYIPRIRRCYNLLSGSQTTGLLFESAWVSFVLNLVMYIMASHVLGAVWYLGALQRWDQCALDTCRSVGAGRCENSFRNCKDGISAAVAASRSPFWYSALNTTCFNTAGEPVSFNYGLFTSAIPLAFERSWFKKYIYSLMWGFVQISTLAGNQVPSYYVPEVLLTIAITAGGLLLFAVLIGNIQNFLQSLTRRTFEYQLHRRDVENWMSRRNLPRSVAKRVRELERLQWSSNQGVDEREVLGSLTEDLQRQVRRHLCLDLIKKSKLFSAMDESTLDFICERLVQRIYIDKTVIQREGSPVTRMFFVVKGELVSQTTGKGQTALFNEVVLSSGDFFGEELLIAYLESTDQRLKSSRGGSNLRRAESSVGRSGGGASGNILDVYPPSERTIFCAGAVEGFTLEAEDLEFMCRQFAQVLSRAEVQRTLNNCSQNRRTRAAITIQLQYRTHLRKKYNINMTRFINARKERRLGEVMQWAIRNPGKQPREVFLNPIIIPTHRAPGLNDSGPKTTFESP